MLTMLNIRLTFDGPFNIGAGALGGTLADKPLTRDARGLPMVPASAFKGRLRHEVERLAPHLRPHDRSPCRSPVAETMCQGSEDPCPVCRLFGSPWHPARLIFSDLILTEPDFLTHGDPPLSDLRYGVALSRQRRVAEDQLLYTTEVFLPGVPLTLSGTITGELDEADLALLRAGLDSLFAIGGGKSRGLGWFDLTVEVQSEPSGSSTSLPAVTAAEDVELAVIVTLRSPLLVGTDTAEAYYKTTQTHIPGSVLRGSLARQVLAACDHGTAGPHNDCDFGRLFQAEPSPIFEDLLPTTTRAREWPLVAPRTARTCKYHPGFQSARDKEEQGHGVGDVLIRQAIFEHMLQNRVRLPVLYQPRCPMCGSDTDFYEQSMVMYSTESRGPLKFDSLSVPVRRTSRTAINRQRAVAAEGQLFTLETIDWRDHLGRETTFRSEVRVASDQVEILSRQLAHLSAIGRGQSGGLGLVRVEVVPPDHLDQPLPKLSERLEKFNESWRAEWRFYERIARIEPLRDDICFFSLNLLSPACLTWRSLPVTAPPPDMLGFATGVTLERAFAADQLRGGWHSGAGLPRRVQLMTAAGSVFLYRSQGFSLEELAERLAGLESSGLGPASLRRQGLGRVVICLPFHYQPEVIL